MFNENIFSMDNLSDSFDFQQDPVFLPKIENTITKFYNDIGNKPLFNPLNERDDNNLIHDKNNFLINDLNHIDLVEKENNNLVLIEKKEELAFNEPQYKNFPKKNDINILISNNSSLETNIDYKSKKKLKRIFKVIYPSKFSLFTEANTNFNLPVNNILLNKKRRRNKEDDVRRTIGRRFFNDIIYNKINDLLRMEGSILILEKLQQDLVYDLVKKCNKKYLDMKLEELFIKKELYNEKNLEKYYHNFNVIKKLRTDEFANIRERTNIDLILNMKYKDLFEEYISSNEFIEEINRLKNNEKFEEAYINNYIYYSLHFLENFSN